MPFALIARDPGGARHEVGRWAEAWEASLHLHLAASRPGNSAEFTIEPRGEIIALRPCPERPDHA